jgi:hypothetical protein
MDSWVIDAVATGCFPRDKEQRYPKVESTFEYSKPEISYGLAI